MAAITGQIDPHELALLILDGHRRFLSIIALFTMTCL